MSFEKHSNFNKLANFSEVKFGENKPVLEVELNEMQQIQNEARADIIRDTMPSGFVTLGDIDYDYCANNDNQIKLKTESIAYVNGYRITIPKDTIIEIGESDKEREDLVFLEVWKEAVNDIDTLTEYGGENNAVINNPIKDSRYPVATSQRVQLKYRIRHVADIDFNTYVCDGFTKEASSVSGFTHNNQQVLAIGGLSDETSLGESHRRFFNYKQRSHYKNINNGKNVPFEGSTDCGLYVAGNERDKTQFNTIDGYVYAIPMFRLIRKPNVGLCTPFEYKKIHNQLDPKKFAHLVGQENVEKVHSVNVKGKTYKNLVKVANSVRANQNTEVNIYLEPNTKYIAFGNFANSSNPGTFALLCLSTVYAPNGVLYGSGDDLYTQTVMNGVGKEIRANKTLNYITFNSENYPYCHVRSGGGAGGMFSDLMLFKYEDEMEELTLEYFKGVKSLGELDNNSITVENNLVEEGTYVHELQNHILPTHPEVTYVTWGEDVVIPPEVEIELKNGEEVIQTITQLPVKLETTGEEKLHVKTMKGRTLVNLATSPLKTVTATNSWQPLSPISLVSGKKYLAIFHVESNTLDSVIKDVFKSDDGRDTAWGIDIIPAGKVGTFKRTFVAPFDTKSYHIYSDSSSQGSATVKCVLLEYVDGMENWGIKYFEGMQSVKMPVLTTVGKNLFDFNIANADGGTKNEDSFSFNNTSNIDYNRVKVDSLSHLIKGETYTLSCLVTNKHSTTIDITTGYGINGTSWISMGTVGVGEIKRVSMTFIANSDKYGTRFLLGSTTAGSSYTISQIQIEQGSVETSYEPYKSNILSTPEEVVLRSLPNGIKDTLNLMTGEYVQRIGEVIKNNSTGFILSTGGWENKSDVCSFENFKPEGMKFQEAKDKPTLNCDKVPSNTFTDQWNNSKGIESITQHGGGGIVLSIARDKLLTQDVNGLNTYLQSNPLTIQYELATPIIKTVDLTEDDYVGKSKVTYQLAEPLNYIPNGAYDEIKGDKLIKRTNKIYLDGTETWSSFRDETNTTHRISLPIEDGKPSSVCVCSHFEYGTGATVEKVKIYMTVNANLSITVLKSDFPTVDSFKTWLSNNRPMVIYELANPIEIPLKEVSPLECDFSLNRQFKRGYENCLKELPNGVKDTVDGKLITRRIAHLCINNTIPFAISESNDSYPSVLRIWIREQNIPKLKPNCSILCDTLPVKSKVNSPCIIATNGLDIHLPLSNNASVQDAQEYLRQNPINVFYELSTPTTEELTEENSRYVPYMPLNSYVGSLYVADGINRTKFLTDFSPSEYEVQTYHRYFSNEFNMFEDITLKKSPYGHKTYLEEVDGRYVEKFIAGLEKHEIEDLRHKVSLTGFDYSQLLQDSFLKLIKGELS